MKLLLTGRDGQVGHELLRTLAPLGEIIACSRAEMDLSQPQSLRQKVRSIEPDWIVNAAAYTAVDQAEKEEALATAINDEAPGVLAEEAKKLDAGFVHFSTDYVFDGSKSSPYVETDAPNPLGAYGRSKLAGEKTVQSIGGRAWIFRTSWVYAPRGKNFLLTILRLANERPSLRVVADQFGAPTTAALIAESTAKVIDQQIGKPLPSGLYHLTASGRTTWHGFAEAIVKNGAARGLCGDIPVDPITTAEYPLPAKRPANSVMDQSQLAAALGERFPDWREGLKVCLDQVAPQV